MKSLLISVSLLAFLYSPMSNSAGSAVSLTLESKFGNVPISKGDMVSENTVLVLQMPVITNESTHIQVDYINPKGERFSIKDSRKDKTQSERSDPMRLSLTYYPELAQSLYTFIVSVNNEISEQYKIAVVPALGKSIVRNIASVPASYSPQPYGGKMGLRHAFTTTERMSQTPPAIKLRGGIEVYEKMASSVVLITTDDGLGTGVVISDDGTILTNWHVIEGYDVVTVFFKPDNINELSVEQGIVADVEKIDQVSDLALLRLRYVDRVLTPVELALTSNIKVAQVVHAIGHPHGEFWTYTQGLVSQKRPNYNWQTSETSQHSADVIQTQTPINPGNSGGPLLTDDFKLVGINSFVNATAQGLYYAVASTTIESFLDSTENNYFAGSDNEGQFEGAASTSNLRATGPLIEVLEEAIANDNVVEQQGNSYFIDQDGDGNVDFVLTDFTENGVIDTIITEEEYKGESILVWHIDEDEDGEIDYRGLDIDADGDIDSFHPA